MQVIPCAKKQIFTIGTLRPRVHQASRQIARPRAQTPAAVASRIRAAPRSAST